MRKEATIVIDAEGRDKGKIFRLTEMSASQAEAWASRLLLALSKAGVEVPDGFFEMGMGGIAALGLRSLGGLPWDVAKPLLEEMMACIKIQPSAAHSEVVRALIEDDIEEVMTRVRLREEVITLHTGFSVRDFYLNFRAMREAQAARAAEEALGIGQDTEMSPQSSDGSSRLN